MGSLDRNNREINYQTWLALQLEGGDIAIVDADLAAGPYTAEDLERWVAGDAKVLSWEEVEAYGARPAAPARGNWVLFETLEDAETEPLDTEEVDVWWGEG